MAAPLIHVHDVARHYPMGEGVVRALDGVSFEVARGACALVVGRSGSGKSTLLHLLAAMDRPTAGRLSVDGLDLGALDEAGRTAYRRQNVGLVFQQFHLVPTMTAAENAALPLVLAGVAPAERERRARAALDRVGLADRWGHRPTALSGGEQQRVALARALVADPPLLLADEPTGNLDSATAAEIVGLLGDLRDAGKTVVVVTHDPSGFSSVADRLVRLADGRVVADETMAALAA